MGKKKWTVTLKEHTETLIKAERDLRKAHDQRYKEVNIEKDKALTIKEEAVKTALGLASTELRTAIDDLKTTIKPLVDYVSSQQGKSTGLSNWFGYIIAVIMTVVTVATIFLK